MRTVCRQVAHYHFVIMDISRLRLITFDLDETLWPSSCVLQRAEEALHGWLQRHYPHIAERYTIEGLRAMRLELAEREPRLKCDLTALRHAGLRLVARATGAPESLADEAMQVFLEARNQVTLYEEVLHVLRQLRGRYRLATLTNGNADVFRTPVGPLIDFGLSSADARAAKPDPALFRIALQRAGVRPEEALHVGDDPECDMLGARGAGMLTAWINRTGGAWPEAQPRADVELVDLHDLLDWLRGQTQAADP